MLETGTIKRFDSPGNFSSYCRCVKGAKYSNGKKKGATNQKNGNRYIAWAFTEAANFAIRYNPTIRKYYQRSWLKPTKLSRLKQLHINSQERVITYLRTMSHLMNTRLLLNDHKTN